MKAVKKFLVLRNFLNKMKVSGSTKWMGNMDNGMQQKSREKL